MSSERNFPKRGEVYWVNLDPSQGSEIKKTRPSLIVSNDTGNEFSNIVMVAPITSKVRRVFPFEVKTEIDGKAAKIMLNQCRAVDKSRIAGKICKVDQGIMQEVVEAIKVVFAIN